MAFHPSSNSSNHKGFKYDVFLCFRGEDTRNNFVDHLYAALERHGIQTFKDVERGNSIDDELLNAIENSKLSIVVLSKNFASSSWCLDELVKILELRRTKLHTVLPLFYHVEPFEIRNQSGTVGKAFEKLSNNKVAGSWKQALKDAADLAGWVLNNTADGREAIIIQEIVERILLQLPLIPNHFIHDEKLVGMESRMQALESHLKMGLDDVRMIGFCGMGGIGKTTLLSALFKRISIQFEAKCFVKDVSEVSKTSSSGMLSLQRQVLSEVLKDQDISISSVDEGERMMRMLIRRKKVLVVLDDVDCISQLKALAGEHDWFDKGSRIIITTRDEHVLVTHGVKWIHRLNPLSKEEAAQLFNNYAFGSDVPIQGYEELSHEIVHYAVGLPLTLKVLGSLLYCKDKLEWMDVLKRQKTIPLRETVDILELSYNGLQEECKKIFLDVACFMKRWDINQAIRILESCGFRAANGLRVLKQRSLITISDSGNLGMHDLIQEMGRNIVRRLHPGDPNKHSRLWIPEEIENILANDLGTEATETIIVDRPMKLSYGIVTNGFRSMENLRILLLVSGTDDGHDSNSDSNIDQVHQNFPNSLKVLSWVGYPHRSLPETFLGNNLVRLDMFDSKIIQLWEGGERKVLNNLRFLDLSFSRLTSLDLGLTPSLERLELEGCDDLVELQVPPGSLQSLVYLNLSACSRISSFLFIQRLESLEVLCLTCLFLKEFPDIIPVHCNNRLQELRFRYNDIKELPSSIANLQKLVTIDLHSCRNLSSLPGSICNLQKLRNLELYGCSLEELPQDIGRLESLEELNLSFTRIKDLPDSIGLLKRLKTLNLSSCWNLEKLPRDLGQLESLQNLVLSECTQVIDIPDSISMLTHLKNFSLLNCILIEDLPEGLGCLELEVLNVKGTRIKHLPRSIYLLKDLKIYGPMLGVRSRGSKSTSATLEASSIIKQKIDY